MFDLSALWLFHLQLKRYKKQASLIQLRENGKLVLPGFLSTDLATAVSFNVNTAFADNGI